VQPLLPEHEPDHPVKMDVESAVGINVTSVPESKLDAQLAPHSMPDGALDTTPVPFPVRVTVSVGPGGGGGGSTIVTVSMIATKASVPPSSL
jgi:hypothetical protein